MKRKAIVVLIAIGILFTACTKSFEISGNSDVNSKILNEVYYTTSGFYAKLSGNYLVVVEKGLKVINLNTKKVIKQIDVANNGFDIYGTKIVWSAYSGKRKQDNESHEVKNMDIFLYDIVNNKTKQITASSTGKVEPKIWGDYIVWQDNRNDSIKDDYSEWDIYLYNMSTKQEKQITTAPGIHTRPSINDYKIVWEDGRNFTGNMGLRWGENVPENNTDIYMYDIKTGKETAISTKPLQECKPDVNKNYVVWEDRNEKAFAADIYMYDFKTKKTTKVTDDKYNQTEPKLFDKYIVWMDERNGTSSNDVIINGQAPNSDIFLYDIQAKKEYLMTGKEPQIMPVISNRYIACITSRQIKPEIQVIKYK